MMRAIFSLSAVSVIASSAVQSEYLAVVPNGGGAAAGDWQVKWLRLDYPTGGPRSTSDVNMVEVSDEEPLGNWNHLDLSPYGALFAAKVHNDTFYVYMNTDNYADETVEVQARQPPVFREPDTIRAFPRSGSAGAADFDISRAIVDAVGADVYAHATHTFDVAEIDGEPLALCMVQYNEPELGNAPTDGIVAVSLRDGSARPTADGKSFLNLVDVAGTMLTDMDSTRFKMQYVANIGQQWHGNGVARFVTSSGLAVLAITARRMTHATLMKDPFTYTSAQGGGRVLQRFGSPVMYDSKGEKTSVVRDFGASKADRISSSDGVHNVWYQRYPSGRETVTMFANGVEADAYSHVFEFDLNLVEGSAAADDSIFETNYSTAAFTWKAPAQGGARPLGENVWIGAGGILGGYQIVDLSGKVKSYSTDAPIYDPFVSVPIPAAHVVV